MGVAVEDREQSHDPHREGDRGLAGECYDGAEHDHRGGDAEFDEWQWDAGHADGAAARHGEDEGRGHEPERAAAELPGKDADGDHRQNVVEPAERMRETVNETVRVADAGMSEGGGGNEREGGGRQANAHGRSLLSAKQSHRRKIAYHRRGPQGRAARRSPAPLNRWPRLRRVLTFCGGSSTSVCAWAWSQK